MAANARFPFVNTRHSLFGSAALLLASIILGATLPTPGAGAADEEIPATPVTVPGFRRASNVFVLPVSGVIDGVTLYSLERRIRRATREGADAIVIELDTPGGELSATLDICNLLKDRSVTPTNTVAWVHPQAFSAGTIIALASREIVVSPGATFGDAAPIHGMPLMGLIQMQAAERAKIEAPLLSEVMDSARRNHYDENLVQSFVAVGMELWLIEHRVNGERVFVGRGEYERLFGEQPPDTIETITSAASVGSPGAAGPATPQFNSMFSGPAPEQQPGMSEEEIRAWIEYEQQLPPSRTALDSADRDDWMLVSQVISNDRLLTVRPAEALAYGLCQAVIADDQALALYFGAQTVTRIDASWSEALVRFLVSWPVRIILSIVFILGLFLEMAAPGVGLFGATAAAALLMLVGAPYLAGMAQWWDILLIIAGIILVGLELFVIPGTGIAGVAGALCLLIGLIGTFVSGDVTTQQGQNELGVGLATVLTSVFAGSVGVWLLSRHFGALPIFRRLILTSELGTGPSAAPSVTDMAVDALEPGSRGVTVTDLRPAGRAEFDGRVIHVQSVGPFIDPGTPVVVVNVGRFVIEVEAASS